MEMFKESSRNQFALFLGLLVLVGSCMFSLYAVYRLEKALVERRDATEALESYDELAKKVKDWALVLQVPEEEQDEIALLRQQKTLKTLEAATQTILKKAAHSPTQVKLVPKLVGDILSLTEDADGVDWDTLQEIDKTLDAMNHIESERIEHHSRTVLAYINRLVFGAGISVVIALLIILLSLKAKRKDDEAKAQLIEDLRKLKEEAESASQLKSKFLSTVSHEIRTPLNGIIGISDVLLNTPVSASDKSFAKTINQSGKTLLRIINDILDFSKIESGKIDFLEAEFSPVDVLHQVLSTLAPKAVEKNLKLDYEIDEKLPKNLKGDPERLAQVLFNLVGNAIKFTQSGSIFVKMAVKDKNPNTVSVEFSVADTGIGVSKNEIENLFKPFVQVRRAGTAGEPGSGLGLSISQSIVKAMGGTINVESTPEKGSTFSFVIPFQGYSEESVTTTPHFTPAKTSEEVQPVETLSGQSYRPRILVAEDNPTNQVVAQSMLERLDVDFALASNGEEVLEIVEKSQIDLILMDCHMPVLDGFEATRRLREKGKSLPVLAMTANAFDDDEQKCLASGMNDFISKPVDLQTLREKIAKHLPKYRDFSSLPLNSLDSSVGVESRRKVVRSFLSTTSVLKETISKAIQNKDLEELKRIAHRFKGASQTVGGNRLAEICKTLEQAESVDVVAKRHDEILNAISSLESQLEFYS
jgi:signal transduction histidine kinase/DNA-binding response OmpR family regulator